MYAPRPFELQLGDLLQNVKPSSSDVDLGSVGSICLRDDEASAISSLVFNNVHERPSTCMPDPPPVTKATRPERLKWKSEFKAEAISLAAHIFPSCSYYRVHPVRISKPLGSPRGARAALPILRLAHNIHDSTSSTQRPSKIEIVS